MVLVAEKKKLFFSHAAVSPESRMVKDSKRLFKFHKEDSFHPPKRTLVDVHPHFPAPPFARAQPRQKGIEF